MDSAPLKLLLVEDDDSLREIYSTRLAAEGFSIFFAKDGEEALATAVKVRPDIIVSDVMMPRISGFDMLDILRQTPETATTRVIMMTALGSEADIERGNKLGADKYLVKSQVTLEDLVNTVHEVARSINSGDNSNISSDVTDEDKSMVNDQIAGLDPAMQPPAQQQPPQQ